MRDGLVRPGLLLLLVCLALPASSQQIWPLDVTLTAERVEDMAVGTVTIINPTKQPVEVGKVVFNIVFYDSSDTEKGDIKQDFVLRECSATTLPVTLAQGEEVVCPFTTNNNIYHGVIRIIAAVMRTETPDSALNEALGLEIIDKLMPASSSWGSSSTNAASNSGNAGTGDSAAPGFIAIAHANIPGNDIACCQSDWEGKPAPFCRICGGTGAVSAACNKIQECVAFDMEGSNCGYLKASNNGPFKQPAPGFTTYLRA